MEMAQKPEAAGVRNNPRVRAGSRGVDGAQGWLGHLGPGREDGTQGQRHSGEGPGPAVCWCGVGTWPGRVPSPRHPSAADGDAWAGCWDACERGLRQQQACCRGQREWRGSGCPCPRAKSRCAGGSPPYSAVLSQHGCAPGSASAAMGLPWACLEEQPALGLQAVCSARSHRAACWWDKGKLCVCWSANIWHSLFMVNASKHVSSDCQQALLAMGMGEIPLGRNSEQGVRWQGQGCTCPGCSCHQPPTLPAPGPKTRSCLV